MLAVVRGARVRAEEDAALETRKGVALELEGAVHADERGARGAAGARRQAPDAHAVEVDLVLRVDAAEAGEGFFRAVIVVFVRLRVRVHVVEVVVVVVVRVQVAVEFVRVGLEARVAAPFVARRPLAVGEYAGQLVLDDLGDFRGPAQAGGRGVVFWAWG